MSTKLNHTAALQFIYNNLSDKELNSLKMSDEYVSDKTKNLAAQLKASQIADYNASPVNEFAQQIMRKLAHVAAKAKKLDETLLVNELLTSKGEVRALTDTDDRVATYVANAINSRIAAQLDTTPKRTSIDVARLKKMYKAFGANASAITGCANFFGITEEQVSELIK